MNVVFRVDASHFMGTGHVMRCLTLADALRLNGCDVLFMCREHPGNLLHLIQERGFAACSLPVTTVGPRSALTPLHGEWLGVSWEQDADETRRAMSSSGTMASWLVTDHYALDERWEHALRADVDRIMVIDDLADRAHDCDLLLDQNLLPNSGRYADKVAEDCSLLIGPEYALLHPSFAQLHENVRIRNGAIKRLFVFFGGADRQNLVGRCLSAFLTLSRPDIDVDVVLGYTSPHFDVIQRQIKGHPNIQLHESVATLAPLMAAADLAVGAGGATSWERLCLGLPAVVVTLAGHQIPIAKELNRRKLVQWLGDQTEVDEPALARKLEELLGRGLDEEWSRRCLATVDGRGVDRVIAAMLLTRNTPLRARRADLADEELLLRWANEPVTRRNAFSERTISRETHHKWFRTGLGQPETFRLFLVETEKGIAVGQVRFERVDRAWRIDYALAAPFRGRGIGRRLLETALRKFSEQEREAVVFGQVKESNVLSCRVFESLGFDARREGDTVEYRLALR